MKRHKYSGVCIDFICCTMFAEHYNWHLMSSFASINMSDENLPVKILFMIFVTTLLTVSTLSK